MEGKLVVVVVVVGQEEEAVYNIGRRFARRVVLRRVRDEERLEMICPLFAHRVHLTRTHSN